MLTANPRPLRLSAATLSIDTRGAMPLSFARGLAAAAPVAPCPFLCVSDLQGKHMTMADRHHDFEPHAATWRGFIRGSIAIILATVFVLAGLLSVGFGSTLPYFLGFLGIIIGVIAIVIDLRTGARSFGLSLGILAVFALITLINVY
jgi:cytochrome c biogenesis protein CcdA